MLNLTASLPRLSNQTINRLANALWLRGKAIRRKEDAVEVIAPDEGRRGLNLYIKLLPFSMLLAFFPIVFILIVNEDFPIGYLVILFLVVLGLYVFSYIFLNHFMKRRIQPILIYRDGIKGYSSPYYSLIGLHSFITIGQIEQLSIEPRQTILRLSDKRSQIRGVATNGEWDLTVKLLGRGNRVIGSGSPKRMVQAAYKIERTLGIRAIRQGDADELLGFLNKKMSSFIPVESDILVDNNMEKNLRSLDFAPIVILGIFALFGILIGALLITLFFVAFILLFIVIIYYRERRLRPTQLRLNSQGIELTFRSGAKRYVPFNEIALLMVYWGDPSRRPGMSQQGGALDIGKNYSFFLNREVGMKILRTIFSNQ
jgi:hypothetical protein